MIDAWFELFPYSCKAYQVADTFIPMSNFDIGVGGVRIADIPLYIIMLAYGIFYGIANACAVVVPYYMPKSWGRRRIIIPCVILAIILMSHVLFCFWGVHPNSLQVVIGIIAILSIGVLAWRSDVSDHRGVKFTSC